MPKSNRPRYGVRRVRQSLQHLAGRDDLCVAVMGYRPMLAEEQALVAQLHDWMTYVLFGCAAGRRLLV